MSYTTLCQSVTLCETVKAKSKRKKETRRLDQKEVRRLDQVVKWLEADQAPLIIFDECHKAKNIGGNASLYSFVF